MDLLGLQYICGYPVSGSSQQFGWPDNALRHHWLMPINCHFRDCKALLVASLIHVSGAIKVSRPLPLPLILLKKKIIICLIQSVGLLGLQTKQAIQIIVREPVPNFTFTGAEMREYNFHNRQNLEFCPQICHTRANRLHNFTEFSAFVGVCEQLLCGQLRCVIYFQLI